LRREFCPGWQHWCLDTQTRAPYSSEVPRTGSVTSFQIFQPKQHLHGRCLGLPVRGNDTSCENSNRVTVAAEILIAQLNSQSKLTTAWHVNRKIWYENEFLKAK
jgi:hypothetical protein